MPAISTFVILLTLTTLMLPWNPTCVLAGNPSISPKRMTNRELYINVMAHPHYYGTYRRRTTTGRSRGAPPKPPRLFLPPAKPPRLYLPPYTRAPPTRTA
uniref:Uncharacterized protein n=1 Tax=Rhipicephalus appendiculatus TaxID=34631 RepID=A0A131YED1_RHIAP